MVRDYLKNNDVSIKSGADVNSVMRNIMSLPVTQDMEEKILSMYAKGMPGQGTARTGGDPFPDGEYQFLSLHKS